MNNFFFNKKLIPFKRAADLLKDDRYFGLRVFVREPTPADVIEFGNVSVEDDDDDDDDNAADYASIAPTTATDPVTAAVDMPLALVQADAVIPSLKRSRSGDGDIDRVINSVSSLVDVTQTELKDETESILSHNTDEASSMTFSIVATMPHITDTINNSCLIVPPSATATTTAVEEEYIAEMHAFFRNKVCLPVRDKDDRIARALVLKHQIVSPSDLSWLLAHRSVDNRVQGEMALTACEMNSIWIERIKQFCNNNNPNKL